MFVKILFSTTCDLFFSYGACNSPSAIRHWQPAPGPLDIPLSGILIEPEHAIVTRDASTGECAVAPASKSARVFHNGALLPPPPAAPVKLKHFDRLQFGAVCVVVFRRPE